MKIQIFKIIIASFIGLLSYIASAENTLSDTDSNAIILKSTSISPDCSSGCNQEIAGNVSTIIIENDQTVCLTGMLDGDVTFQGTGGTLRICGSANIVNINVIGTNNATIEITTTGVVTVGSISFGSNNFEVKNWGVLNGRRYEMSRPFENYGTATFSSVFTVNYNTYLINSGNIAVTKEITVNGTINNNEGATLSTGNYLKNRSTGTINNSGSIVVDDIIYNRSEIVNYATGTISVVGAYKNEDSSSASIENYGVLTSDATVYCNIGVIDNKVGGIINTLEFFNDKSVVNSGTINVSHNFTNEASFLNNGVLTVDKYCYNNSPGIFSNTADVNVLISFFNSSSLQNSGDIDVVEYFVNSDGGSVTNSSSISVTLDLLNKKNSSVINANNGIINVDRAFKNDSASTVNNQSVLIVSSGFENTNLSEIVNSGTLTINHTLSNVSASTVQNSGEIIITKNLDNTSSVVNSGKCTIAETLYNTRGIFENNDRLYVNTGITQSAEFINRGEVNVDGLFSSNLSSTTLLDDGAIFNVKNLDVYGSITGENDYSSIVVEGATKIYSQGTIDGNISLLDKNGIELTSGSIASSVVREATITNNCLKFTGSNQYLEVNNVPSLNLQSQGAVEVMVKLSDYSDYAGIVCKGSGNTSVKSTSGYALQMGGLGLAAPKERALFSMANGEGSYVAVKSSSNLELGRWYHLVATWDTDNVYLYVNGILNDVQPIAFSAATNSNSLIIGSQIPETTVESTFFPYAGELDNVRVWNKTLTRNEIWANFGSALSAQSNIILNTTFETKAADNTYFISTSSPTLNVYTRNFSQISTTDRVKDEVLMSRVLLNKNIAYDQLVINANTVLALRNNATCRNLIITTSGKLDIPAGTSLTVNGDMYIKSDATGCGQIFVEGDLVLNGKVYVEQTFIGDESWEFRTVPAIVPNISIYGDVFNGDYAVYEYSQQSRALIGPTSNVWVPASVLVPGRGYIFAFLEPKSVIYDITGTTFLDPTEGEISLDYTESPRSVDHEGWNLIGNPFLTTISWDQVVLDDENSTFYNEADAAIYIHNNSDQNYTSYVDGESVNGVFEGSFKPFEAFFVKAVASTPVVKIRRKQFPAALVNRAQHVKAKNLLRATLRFGSEVDETLVRFNEGATVGMDSKYDAFKMIGEGCQIYTSAKGEKELSINTMSLEDQSLEIDLFVKCNKSGQYQLNLNDSELAEYTSLFLIDKLTGNCNDVSTEPTYNFVSDSIGVFNRFMIILRRTEITTIKDNPGLHGVVYCYNGIISVLNSCDSEVKVCDLNGRQLYSGKASSSNFSVNQVFSTGVYLISVGKDVVKLLID